MPTSAERGTPEPTRARGETRGDRPLGVDLRLWAGVVLLVALLLTAYRHLDHLARGGPGDLLRTFLEEGTAAFGAGVLFFAVGALVRRLPLDRPGRWRRLPLYVPALVVFSVLHTSSNWLLRELAFRVAGRGDYDYGRMPLRYVMEFPVDLGLFVLMVLFFHGLRHLRRARANELRAARLEASLARSEVRSLQLQLQPHFLFNSLHAVSSVMYDDPARADEMLDRLSELLRASLRTARDKEIALGEELRVLDAYLALLDARFAERLRVERQIEDALEDALVPPFLLQPLVENAVRHGGVETGGESKIRITARTEKKTDGDALRLEVEDQVKNQVPDQVPDGGGGRTRRRELERRGRVRREDAGLGLGTTEERLRILYGDAASLEATDLDDGFRVVLRLPLRRNVRRNDSRGETDPAEEAA